MFGVNRTGELVPISGTDPHRGPWTHRAFVPAPLPFTAPDLKGRTYRAVADARAALAALDSTARHLPNPRLLRRSTLRLEAQSTSALEGTYEPIDRVLVADDVPGEPRMREVINYEVMAESAFDWLAEGRPLTVGLLCNLQQTLVTGTPHERPDSGQLRTTQVIVGRRSGASGALPVLAARFVPPPPGSELGAGLRDLVDWVRLDQSGEFDAVISAAMAHYQFETLHPFHDGNGRLGRLLIVLQLLLVGTLAEPILTVSPWFESRRAEYQDLLLAVSTQGRWDDWITFFANGLAQSASLTQRRMLDLVGVQADLKQRIVQSSLRAGTAHALVDFAVSRITFTVRQVELELGVSYPRANKLVESLIELDVLSPVDRVARNRRFYAPAVLAVIAGPS